MPKVIENLREKLLEEARRQVGERGFGRTTIRSVAQACGVATGTVYNYFPSKEMLVATFMAQDWRDLTESVARRDPADRKAYIHAVYEAIRRFSETYKTLFADGDALRAFYAVFTTRHAQLREGLAALLLPVCPAGDAEERAFLAAFTAEALLTWTVAQIPFDQLYAVLNKTLEDQKKGR
ncbi:MAG: TetR/AcrR family transcriptional regulator [Clostridia bacterium]|nr:TetR/AcrR family transcriptional regulator [Clostridia bacterium]